MGLSWEDLTWAVITTFVAGTNAIRCYFKFSVVTTQEIKFNCIPIMQMHDVRHTRSFYFQRRMKGSATPD